MNCFIQEGSREYRWKLIASIMGILRKFFSKIKNLLSCVSINDDEDYSYETVVVPMAMVPNFKNTAHPSDCASPLELQQQIHRRESSMPQNISLEYQHSTNIVRNYTYFKFFFRINWIHAIKRLCYKLEHFVLQIHRKNSKKNNFLNVLNTWFCSIFLYFFSWFSKLNIDDSHCYKIYQNQIFSQFLSRSFSHSVIDDLPARSRMRAALRGRSPVSYWCYFYTFNRR